MSYTVLLTNFRGPLELLLQLIEREQLDITEIALSKVTTGYLEHMNQLELEADELNWFIEIAAKLIGIKSAILVPSSKTAKEQEESQDLTEQLKLYRLYRDAAQRLGELTASPLHSRPNTSDQYNQDQTEFESIELPALSLSRIYADLLKRSADLTTPPQPIIKKTTINHAIAKLELILAGTNQLTLKQLLEDADDKQEAVLFFLAILELLKQNRLRVEPDHTQTEHYTLELIHA